MSKKAEERDANYKKIQELRSKVTAGTATFAERNIVKIFDKKRDAAKRKDMASAKAVAATSGPVVGKSMTTGRLKK